MELREIDFKIDEAIATITLDRPHKLNALTVRTFDEIAYVVDIAEKEDSVRALLIRGQGGNFSSGFDVGTDLDKGKETVYARWDRMQDELKTYDKLFHFSKPTVSAVEGYCLGAGFELALISDLVIATDTAIFGTPQIRHCMMPLVRTLWYFNNIRFAKEAYLLGKHFGAEMAKQVGIINYVIPEGDFECEVTKLAGSLAKLPSETARMIKRICNKAMELQGYDVIDKWGMDMCVLSMLMIPTERQMFNSLAESEGMKAALKWLNTYYE